MWFFFGLCMVWCVVIWWVSARQEGDAKELAYQVMEYLKHPSIDGSPERTHLRDNIKAQANRVLGKKYERQ